MLIYPCLNVYFYHNESKMTTDRMGRACLRTGVRLIFEMEEREAKNLTLIQKYYIFSKD